MTDPLTPKSHSASGPGADYECHLVDRQAREIEQLQAERKFLTAFVEMFSGPCYCEIIQKLHTGAVCYPCLAKAVLATAKKVRGD